MGRSGSTRRRQGGKIRPVPGVGVGVPGHDRAGLDDKRSRHDPRVSRRPPRREPLLPGRQSPAPHPWSEHLEEGSPPETERPVQIKCRVGDRTGPRPEVIEDLSGGFELSLEHEHDRRKVGFSLADSPELRNGLPAEQSPEVPQEDEDRRPGSQNISESVLFHDT